MQALQNDAFLLEAESPHLEIDVVQNAPPILQTPEEQRGRGTLETTEDNKSILVNRVGTEDVTPVEVANTQGANTESSEMPAVPLSKRNPHQQTS
jgi:hypothetical protein